MDDEGIVIVDGDGNEHEFPVGMDPKRAAAIVREKTYKPGKLASHALSGDPGGYPEGVDPTQSQTSRIGHALEPLAHPQTTGDMLSLLIPAGAGTAIKAGQGMLRGYLSAGRRAIEGAPNMRSIPGRMLSTLYQDAKAPPARGVLRGVDQYAPAAQYRPSGPAITPSPAVSASAIQGPKQATYAMLPDGSYGLKGAGLVEGETVNVTSRAGVGQMKTVGKVSPDGTATIGGQATQGAGLPSDAIEQLKRAGLKPWQIEAVSRDPEQLKRALEAFKPTSGLSLRD